MRRRLELSAPGTLFVDTRPVAPAEVATTRRARGKGLLGSSELVGALVLSPCRSVHTVGMRFAIDVAICDRAGLVLAVLDLGPRRVTRPRHRGTWIVEAAAGAFERWDLQVGSTLEVRVGTPAQAGSPGSST